MGTYDQVPGSLISAVGARWWLVALCAILVAATAGLLSSRQEKRYEATAELLFRNDTAPDQSLQSVFGLASTATTPDPTRTAATNVALVSLGTVSDMTARAVGQQLTAGEVQSEVAVQSVGQSDLVSITATDPSPTRAATLANTFARQFIVFRQNIDRAVIESAINGIQDQLNALSPPLRTAAVGQGLTSRLNKLLALAQLQNGNAELVQSAALPSAPALPRTKLNLLGGGILGVILGIGLALFLYRIDRRMRSPADLSMVYALPLLGVVPYTRELRSRRRSLVRTSPPLPIADANGAASTNGAALPAQTAEAFRAIRARLRYINRGPELRSVLVTSADRGEGKSTIAWQLARVIAMTRRHRVLVLEADLRRPAFARVHGLRATPGLSEVLTHDVAAESAIQHVDVVSERSVASAVAGFDDTFDWTRAETFLDFMSLADVERARRADADGEPAAYPLVAKRNPTMDVLVAGASPNNPSDLLEGEELPALLHELSERYDFIVFDAAPGPVVSETFPLATQADGVIIVGSLPHTSKDAACVLRSQLDQLGAPVLGVVANNARRPAEAYDAAVRQELGADATVSETTTDNELDAIASAPRSGLWIGGRKSKGGEE